MKHPFKNALTLLAAMTLLLAQSGIDVSGMGPAVPKKGCCEEKACPTRCCAEGDHTPAAPVQPAIPASSVAQDFQVALAPALATVWRVEQSVEPSFNRNVFSHPLSPAVALYLRTHSFLI